MSLGIVCQNCGHRVQVPTLCSIWVSRADSDRGCMITGINENDNLIYVQHFVKDKNRIIYEFEGNRPVENYIELDYFLKHYKLESS